MDIVRILLRGIIVGVSAYGVILLAIEMYHERLELHGFDVVAACFGFIPFVFLLSLLPVIVIGLIVGSVLWLFKINNK